jgi:hypothetical protein
MEGSLLGAYLQRTPKRWLRSLNSRSKLPRTAKKRHEQTISSAVNKKLPLLWKTYIDDPLWQKDRLFLGIRS